MNRRDQWELVHEIRAMPEMDYEDYEILGKLGRLSRKHHFLCEESCNGNETQWIRGQRLTTDQCIAEVEAKIVRLTQQLKVKLSCEFQHDPRGMTVKLHTKGTETTGQRLVFWMLR
jgi:hypothetical protein